MAALEEQKQIVENLSPRLNRRLYINDWFYERIQEAESRLRARRASPPRHHRFRPRPTATHGPRRNRRLILGRLNLQVLPVYEMVRTHGTVTDLWHEWSVG